MADSMAISEVCRQQAAAPLINDHADPSPANRCKTKKKKKQRGKFSNYYKASPSSSSSSSSSSSTETLATLAADQNNNNRTSTDLINKHSAKSQAVTFKYSENAPREDIEAVRKLLIEERDKQIHHLDQDEVEFYRADFERMLEDDWLVTRFLLRGKKAYERLINLLPAAHFQSISKTQMKQAVHSETLELIKICAKFRYDYRINNQTRLVEFPNDWVKVNGLFDYKPDRAGNPTVYLRVALHRPKLIESPGARHLFKRYMLYTLEQCDQQLRNQAGKAICCIFDMTGVAFENIDLELTSWMIKSFKSSSPKLMCYVVIYNPPWFFTATFKLICNTLLSNSKRQSVKFAHGDEILNYVDYSCLPEYLQSLMN